MNQDIPIDELRKLFTYDAETGRLIWSKTSNARAVEGSQAGCLNRKGYRLIGLHGRQYRAHRIVVALNDGKWPPEELFIDHIDGNRDNNRLTNLRLCTPSENQHNRIIPSNNTSGLLGVSYDRQDRNWRASICVRRKRFRIGNFSSPEHAHQAYLNAKATLHPIQPIPRQAKALIDGQAEVSNGAA